MTHHCRYQINIIAGFKLQSYSLGIHNGYFKCSVLREPLLVIRHRKVLNWPYFVMLGNIPVLITGHRTRHLSTVRSIAQGLKFSLHKFHNFFQIKRF